MEKQKDLDVVIRNLADTNSSESEKALSNAINTLVKEFTLAKNFNKRQIKAMSLLKINSIFSDIIDDWIDNMKHLKGNYRKACEKLLKTGFEGLANITKTEKEGFIHNIFNRNR